MGSAGFEARFKDELIDKLTNELIVLRAKARISQKELSDRVGIARQTYCAIEHGKKKMSWNTFLSLLLIFGSNVETAKIIQQVGCYPPELEQYIKLENLKTKENEYNG